MIYTPLTQKAMHIAYQAHHGQFDKSGAPYIFHPIHLAEQMDEEFACCVSLLHDTVEDTYVTIQDLKAHFPKEVTDAVQLMTHDKSVDYFTYVRAIKENPIARKVKLADLAHNSDQSRCVGSGISEEMLQRLKAKYEKATKILTEN